MTRRLLALLARLPRVRRDEVLVEQLRAGRPPIVPLDPVDQALVALLTAWARDSDRPRT